MKIGILETGEVHPDLKARHGDYPAMFEALLRTADPALEFAVVRVVAGEMPAAPTQADAWLVTGSRHGVYDDLPWIEPLKAFLRAAVAARVPVIGICFGHQILAEALGGRAVKSDKGWGLGVQDYELAARPGWMDGLPDRFAVRALHQDQVVELPPAPPSSPARPTAPTPRSPTATPRRPTRSPCSRTPSSAPSSWTSSSRSAPAPPSPPRPPPPRAPRWRARSRAPPGRGSSSPSSAAPRRCAAAGLIRAAAPPPGSRARAPPARPSRD